MIHYSAAAASDRCMNCGHGLTAHTFQGGKGVCPTDEPEDGHAEVILTGKTFRLGRRWDGESGAWSYELEMLAGGRDLDGIPVWLPENRWPDVERLSRRIAKDFGQALADLHLVDKLVEVAGDDS